MGTETMSNRGFKKITIMFWHHFAIIIGATKHQFRWRRRWQACSNTLWPCWLSSKIATVTVLRPRVVANPIEDTRCRKFEDRSEPTLNDGQYERSLGAMLSRPLREQNEADLYGLMWRQPSSYCYLNVAKFPQWQLRPNFQNWCPHLIA